MRGFQLFIYLWRKDGSWRWNRLFGELAILDSPIDFTFKRSQDLMLVFRHLRFGSLCTNASSHFPTRLAIPEVYSKEVASRLSLKVHLEGTLGRAVGAPEDDLFCTDTPSSSSGIASIR